MARLEQWSRGVETDTLANLRLEFVGRSETVGIACQSSTYTHQRAGYVSADVNPALSTLSLDR